MSSKVATQDGWVRVRFGDIAEQINDRVDDPNAAGVDRYVGLEHLDPGSLRVIRWGSPDEVSAQKLRFFPGDIIFGKRRAYQRKVAVAEFAGICSAHAMVLRERAGAIAPGFLIHFMASDVFMERAVQISVGSLSPTINWSSLRDQEFVLPAIDEQQRVVPLLEARRLIGERLVRLHESLDVMRAALVEERLAELRDTTAYVPLSSIAEVAYGITVDSRRRSLSSTRPYLRVANVHRGRFDLSEVKEIGYAEADHACVLRDGDVLVVEGHANVDEIGRAAVWRNELPICLHQNHLIRVRPYDGLDSSFVEIVLNSSLGRRHFRANAKSTSGLNTINSTVVKTFSLPVPDLADQRRLVREVASIARAASTIETRRKRVASLEVPYVQ